MSEDNRDDNIEQEFEEFLKKNKIDTTSLRDSD
jgi:hypothetical protein